MLHRVGDCKLAGLTAGRQVDVTAERLQKFRFVRHLPEQRHSAVYATSLRTGVGQSSGEETAGYATGGGERYAAMARVAAVGLR